MNTMRIYPSRGFVLPCEARKSTPRTKVNHRFRKDEMTIVGVLFGLYARNEDTCSYDQGVKES